MGVFVDANSRFNRSPTVVGFEFERARHRHWVVVDDEIEGLDMTFRSLRNQHLDADWNKGRVVGAPRCFDVDDTGILLDESIPEYDLLEVRPALLIVR